MAVSVPVEPRWADAPPAEVLLWRWVVGELPERVRVLPQVAMTLRGEGRPEEAELDLVLVDPEHGVTVVEVKGGTMSYDAPRARWLQNGHECRDPVQQAKRGRSVLRRALEAAGVDVERVALRWAVATPESRLSAPGEPVLPDALLWDARVQDDLPRRLAFVQSQLTQGEEPLGEHLADVIVRRLRGRDVAGAPALSAAIDVHEDAVRVHTESHRNVLHRLMTNRQVLVTGAAGTGKTILAVEAAVRAACLGDRVMLGCWNVVLGHWLRRTVAERLRELGSPLADEVGDDPTGRVVVGDLGSLALGDRSLDEAVREAGADRRDFFYEDLPEQWHPGRTDGTFDTVVLDEAQDLSETWVLSAAQFVKRDGRFLAFADPAQDLFDTDAALPDLLEVHDELLENFRNTRAIADFVDDFGPIEIDCVAGEGEPVRFVSTASEHVVGKVAEVGKRLMRDEGVTPDELALLTLYDNPARHRSADLAEMVLAGDLVHTNGAAFKGMERPVVVLGIDVDPARRDVEEVRRGIYTTASRARSLLVVVGDPQAARDLGLDRLADQLAGSS